MKKKNIIIMSCGFIVIVGIVAAAIFFPGFKNPADINESTGNSEVSDLVGSVTADVSIIPPDTMPEVVSDILGNVSYDPTYTWADDDPVYFVPNTKCSIDDLSKYSVKELEEDIALLQRNYLEYLKNCKSESLERIATSKYDYVFKLLFKARDNLLYPKTKTEIDENKVATFNSFYDGIKTGWEEVKAKGEDDPLYEFKKENFETAERAKKYFEEGKITIDQAFQAIGVAGETITWDATFSLPD